MTSFFKDESGAVTIEWVGLSAALVGLAIVMVLSVENSTGALGEEIEAALIIDGFSEDGAGNGDDDIGEDDDG